MCDKRRHNETMSFDSPLHVFLGVTKLNSDAADWQPGDIRSGELCGFTIIEFCAVG